MKKATDFFNPAIAKYRAKVEHAEAELKEIVLATIHGCTHDDHIGEFDASPPWRICLHCGLAEEGWGSGYRFLVSELVYKIKSDDFYKLRTASIHQSDDVRTEEELILLLSQRL